MKPTFLSFLNKITVKTLIVVLLLLSTNIKAQDTNPLQPARDTSTPKKEVEQKDIFDEISLLFKKYSQNEKKIDTTTSNKPIYAFVPAVGYTLQTKLAAVISGNVAFRLSPSANLSTITTSATYTQNKQFFIPFLTNISTKKNGYKFLGDFRFYKYPQSTFGLGSSAPMENEDPMVYDYFRFYETVLKKFKGNFYAGAGYDLDYHWRISHRGNKNGAPSDYAKYDTSSTTTSSGITLNAIYDSRDNPINAQKGLFTSIQLRNNLTFIGSNRNWQSLIVDIRKFFHFPENSHNTLGLWSYNAIVLTGKPPYLDLPSTGWDNYNATGRGFIQGRYRGTQMVYLESEYRFRISANGLFGGVVFANEEAFSSVPGSTLQTFQPGYGAGLRVKLNKLSNTNLSIDYGFGTQHSNGLFITVGEIF